MKTMFPAMAVAAALACPVLAHADVLTFEDLGSNTAFFTSTYHGFDFGDNQLATNPWFYTSQVNPGYAPHSGTTYIATDFQLYPGAVPLTPTQAITSATAFIFDGAWFSGAGDIAYELYSGTTMVYASAPSSDLATAPAFIASGYGGAVTGVVVRGLQGYYALDDFTYRVAAVPADVPEPGYLGMAGLLAMGAAMRRRRG